MDTKVQMLRIQDVAKKLNVSQKSVRRYIHSGKLRSNKIGGVHRIEASDLRSFLELSIHKNEKTETYVTNPGKSTKTDKVNWIDISDEWDDVLPNEHTSADLFCGAGGMAKGFEMAGLAERSWHDLSS